MARIVAIDFGMKRVGLATTDPLQIIATPLTTVPRSEAISFLAEYASREDIECYVVGQPFRANGELSAVEEEILKFIDELKKKIPNAVIERQDEQYSSQRAMEALVQSGVRKKQRRKKELLDSTAATLILQDYLQGHL